MRKNYLYLLVALVVLMSACKENEREFYPASRASVYFQLEASAESEAIEEFRYSFVKKLDQKVDTAYLTVGIIGNAVDYDRRFSVEVDTEMTTAEEGLHYKVLDEELVVPAKTFEGQLPVVVYNDDEGLQNNVFYVGLKLVETADFELGPVAKQYGLLSITNQLTKPIWWDDYYYLHFGGAYRQIVHRVFIDVCGRDFSDDEGEASLYGLWEAYGQQVSNYFKENYPVLDKNGVVVEPWK